MCVSFCAKSNLVNVKGSGFFVCYFFEAELTEFCFLNRVWVLCFCLYKGASRASRTRQDSLAKPITHAILLHVISFHFQVSRLP